MKEERNSIFKIRNNYMLKRIFSHLSTSRLLDTIHYNKKLQNKLYKDINDYKKYLQIEIEIIPFEDIYGNFINISNSNDESYYHIYFDDNKTEIKRHYIKQSDNVNKIIITIDYEIKSLYMLFKECPCIKIINFLKFKRKFNEDMSYLFSNYNSVEEINFYEFRTNNANNFSYMFYKCSSLKRLNLSNFKTDNVIDMRGMFYGCRSLQDLIISNFDTSNVTNMSYMFYECSSLQKLNFENFKTDKVYDMTGIFEKCPLLNVKCSEELKKKICDIGFGNVFQKVNSFTLFGRYSNILTPFPNVINDPIFPYLSYAPFFPNNLLPNRINFIFPPFTLYNYFKIKENYNYFNLK